MTRYKIPVIGGDGIGPEIIAEGKKVIDAAGEVFGFDVDWIDYPHGADHYLETGELISEETIRELSACRAIYLGALGDPRVRPGILEKGILLNLRFAFDQYINLRPIRLLEGAFCPIKDKKPEDIDFVVVRENTEDFYIGIGGRCSKGGNTAVLDVVRRMYSIRFGLDIDTDSDEIAYQIGVLSKEGTRRVQKYAFDLAMKRKKHVSSVDKANVLSDMYGFWRESFETLSEDYPAVQTDSHYVDAVTMRFIKDPAFFDVIAAPNMFGDIITDLGAMIQGGLGLSPGGNINPDGTSMFEPIHGSAPKYKGLNRANPIAAIWAGALMLDTLGESGAAAAIVSAVEKNLSAGVVKTPDMGGKSTCSAVGSDIERLLKTMP